MSKLSPEERFATLASRLTQIDSYVNVEALMDTLQVLFDECSTAGIKRTTNVPEFLQKYGKTLAEVNSLRPNREDFETIKVIGRGAFGEVRLVKHKISGATYAMKCLSKLEMLKRSDTAFYWQERDVMALANTDWIISLHYSFQDDHYLYLVMDFVPGGDLVTLLGKYDFSEEWTRFYMAETIMAVDALHQLGYIHRDIKPDNLLLDAGGHVKVADFGTCIKVGKDGTVKSESAIGTPDYISPEVLESQNGNGVYGRECDWWSVGVMMYELLYGDTPFYSESLLGTYGQIMNHSKSLKFPEGDISDTAKDLMKKLICRRDERLGKNGIEEIQSHPFFKGIDWTNLRKTTPPVVPEVNGDADASNFEDIDNEHTHNDVFPTPKTFSGNHLPFIGYTFSRHNRWKIVNGDGSELARVSVAASAAAAASSPIVMDDSELQQQVTTLEKEKSRLKSELDALQKKLDLETDAKKLVETELKATVKKTERSAREQESAMRLMRETEKNSQELEKQMAVIKLELKEANRKLEDEARLRKRAEEKVSRAAEEAEEASKSADAERQLKELRKKLESEISDLKSQLEDASSSSSELHNKNSELEKQLALAQLEVQNMSEKLNELSSMKAGDSKKLEDSERALQDIRAQMAQSQEDLRVANEKSASLSQELTSLKSQLSSEQSNIDKLKDEVAAVEKSKAMSDVEIKNLKSQLKQVESELGESKASTKRLSRTDSMVEASMESLKSELAEMTLQRDSLQKLNTELDRKLSMAEIESRDAHRQAEKSASSLREARQDLDNLREKYDKMYDDLLDTREKARALESGRNIVQEKLDAVNAIIETERAAYKELQSVYSTLAKSNVTSQVEIKEISRKLAAADKAKETLEAKASESIAKLDEVQSKLQKLEQEAKEASLVKSRYEEMRLKQESDLQALAELNKQYSELEKVNALLSIENKKLATEEASAKAELEELRSSSENQKEQLAKLNEMKEHLENEAKRLSDMTKIVQENEQKLQIDLSIFRKKFQDEKIAKEQAIIQSTQKDHALKLAMQQFSSASTSKVVSKAAAPAKLAEIQERKSKDLRNLEKKLQDEQRVSTKLKMQVDAKECELQELKLKLDSLSEQFEKFQMQMDNQSIVSFTPSEYSSVSETSNGKSSIFKSSSSAKLSAPSTASLSMRRKSFETSRTLEGYLKIPKDKNIKKGWNKKFVVVSSSKVFVYDDEKDKGSEPQLIIDLSEIILVRKVTSADVIHASDAEVERIFQMLYQKKGEMNMEVKPVYHDTSVNVHSSRGHEFVSTHFSKPTWCEKCKELIWGLGKQGYCCRKCNYVCHKRCYTEVSPCMDDVEAKHLFFMANSREDREGWIASISALKASGATGATAAPPSAPSSIGDNVGKSGISLSVTNTESDS